MKIKNVEIIDLRRQKRVALIGFDESTPQAVMEDHIDLNFFRRFRINPWERPFYKVLYPGPSRLIVLPK